MQQFMALTQFHVPGYAEAKSGPERLEAVHRYVLAVLKAMDVKLPAYEQAGDAAKRAEALMAWLKDQEGYLLKPMNCPHHIQIYKAEPRSYRDLPVRLAEFGTVYRFEQTGELSGMTRVRGFTQDDAHLFVTPEQIEAGVQRQPRPGAVRAVEPRPERLPGARRPARSGQRQVRRRRRKIGTRRRARCCRW